MIKINFSCIIGFIFILLQNSTAQVFSPVGDGFNQPVAKLFADTINNVVYAGGYFTPTMSVPCKSFCMWDGNAWDSLNNNLTGDVRGIDIFNNEVYICGTGGTFNSNLNQWLGGPIKFDQQNNEWVALDSNNHDGYSNIYNHNGSLYFMGTFDTIGGVASWRIARYDGLNWFGYPILTASGFIINDAIVYNGELYVVGNFSAFGMGDIAKWNGSQWVSVGGGFYGSFAFGNALTIYQGKLVIGGNFDQANGNPGNGIVAWDGSSWSQFGSGVDGFVRSLIVYKNELWVGGSFTSAGGISSFNLAKWNGNQWNNAGINPNNGVTSMCILNDELYIGGGFINVINGDTAKRIMKYSDQTGLESFSVSNNVFSIAPNPSDGLFIIHLNDVFKHDVLIEVLDLLGHKLFSGQILAGEKEKYIKMPASTANGIYYFRINFEKGSFIEKITIFK